MWRTGKWKLWISLFLHRPQCFCQLWFVSSALSPSIAFALTWLFSDCFWVIMSFQISSPAPSVCCLVFFLSLFPFFLSSASLLLLCIMSYSLGIYIPTMCIFTLLSLNDNLRIHNVLPLSLGLFMGKCPGHQVVLVSMFMWAGPHQWQESVIKEKAKAGCVWLWLLLLWQICISVFKPSVSCLSESKTRSFHYCAGGCKNTRRTLLKDFLQSSLSVESQ